MARPDDFMDEARGWIEDCGRDTEDMSESQVLAVIRRHYSGGVDGLARDLNPGKEVR